VTTPTSAGSDAALPLFSFLTTSYRDEQVLPRAVESVLAQTEGDWELIVVDNGYSDDVVQAVKPYLDDPRVQLIRQENRGPVGGTMAAADAASGRYLVPLNADDAITPDFCARISTVLSEFPDIAAVTCDAHLFVDPGEQRLARSYLQSAGLRHVPERPVSLRVADVIDGPSPYYGSAVRREVWDAMGGLQSETPMVDDLDFWLRVLLAGYDVRQIRDRLGRFRMEAGSASRPTDPDRIEQFEDQRERALTRAAEASDDPQAQAALARVLSRLRYKQSLRRARIAFRRGDAESARDHVRTAWSHRRSLRLVAIGVGLTVAPGFLHVIHPFKQRWYSRIDTMRQLGVRRAANRRAERSR
jgi:glycosyltransferase involved in cell wall biosynthesis